MYLPPITKPSSYVFAVGLLIGLTTPLAALGLLYLFVVPSYGTMLVSLGTSYLMFIILEVTWVVIRRLQTWRQAATSLAGEMLGTLIVGAALIAFC